MSRTYEAIGTIEDGSTIVLETPLPVRGRVRVRVRIEPASESATSTSQDLWTFLSEMHARQKARGHVPPTPEEVEAYLEELRSEWRDEASLSG